MLSGACCYSCVSGRAQAIGSASSRTARCLAALSRLVYTRCRVARVRPDRNTGRPCWLLSPQHVGASCDVRPVRPLYHMHVALAFIAVCLGCVYKCLNLNSCFEMHVVCACAARKDSLAVIVFSVQTSTASRHISGLGSNTGCWLFLKFPRVFFLPSSTATASHLQFVILSSDTL
jgi:hypothetical protein